jgi:flagellar basal-body rod protein FlgB
MAIKLDSMFGIHEKALQVRTDRARILANNLANADTPGYKARDIDFKSILESADSNNAIGGTLALKQTHSDHNHQSLMPDAINGLKFRQVAQPSMDGNTVDGNVEKAQFAQNSMQFQATFQFLNGRIKGILSAIRGD